MSTPQESSLLVKQASCLLRENGAGCKFSQAARGFALFFRAAKANSRTNRGKATEKVISYQQGNLLVTNHF